MRLALKNLYGRVLDMNRETRKKHNKDNLDLPKNYARLLVLVKERVRTAQ